MSTWHTQPVFISSTFRDMQIERDYLRDVIFPELQEEFAKQQIQIELVDLRWGIDSTPEQERERKELQVLKVCLDEIDRCRPFIIVLLGDRYGWVPPAERLAAAAREKNFALADFDKSITALEIEYGIWEDPSLDKYCFFYFRNTPDLNSLVAEDRQQLDDRLHSDPAIQGRYQHLQTLKERIRHRFPDRWRNYQLHRTDDSKRQSDLHIFREMMLEDLRQGMLKSFSSRLRSHREETWWDREQASFEQFVHAKVTDFTGRADELALLRKAAMNQEEDAPKLIGVLGEPGSGKSALLARLYELLADEDCLVLAHAAGTSTMSDQVDTLLARWAWQLACTMDPAAQDPTAHLSISSEKQDVFVQLLHEVAATTRVVLLIDALNQFERTAVARQLSWLPEPWPDNVVLIATGVPGAETAALSTRKKASLRALAPFGVADAAAMVAQLCKRHHKVLFAEAARAILDQTDAEGRPAHRNPLWLNIVVEQLLLLDEDDFAGAGLLSGSPEEQLQQLMLQKISGYPVGIAALYEQVFAHTDADLQKRYGIGFVLPMLELLALSQNGLRESDLQVLLAQVGSADFGRQFSLIRRFLRAHLRQTGAWGQWQFTHQQPQLQLREMVGKNGVRYRELHKRIALHLRDLPIEDPIRYRELMYHYLEGGDQSGTIRHLIEAQASDGLPAAITLANFLSEREGLEPAWPWLVEAMLQEGAQLSVAECTTLGNCLHGYVYELLLIRQVPTLAQKVLQGYQQLLKQLPAAVLQENELRQKRAAVEIRIADILESQGEFEPAKQHLKNAINVLAQGRQSEDILIMDWRELALIMEKLGDLARKQGLFEEAANDYFDSQRISKEITAFKPDYAISRWDTFRLLERQGDLHLLQGEFQKAKECYHEALAGHMELDRQFPGDFRVLNGMATVHKKIGRALQQTLVYSEEALIYIQKSQVIFDRLYRDHPEEATIINALSEVSILLGDQLVASGNLERGREAFTRAIQLLQKSYERASPNLEQSKDLVFLLIRLGNVEMNIGNNNAALLHILKSVEIGKEVYQKTPAKVLHLAAYAQALFSMGLISRVNGFNPSALNYYQQSYDLFQEALDRQPLQEEVALNLAVTAILIGEISIIMDDRVKALTYYTLGHRHLKEILFKNPSNTKAEYLLPMAYDGFGDLLLAENEAIQAFDFFSKSFTIRIEQAKNHPESDFYTELAESYYKLGLAFDALGEKDHAHSHYRKAIDQFEAQGGFSRLNSPNRGRYQKLQELLRDPVAPFDPAGYSKRLIWLLQQFLVLPWNPLSLSVLADLLKEKPERLAQSLVVLANRGWLERPAGDGDDVFFLHRANRKALEARIRPVQADVQVLLRSILDKTKKDLRRNPITFNYPWIVYANTLEQYLVQESSIELARLRHQIASINRDLGMITFAFEMQERAVATIEAAGAAQHQEAPMMYDQLGHLHRYLGRNKQAYVCHEKALAIRNTQPDPHPVELARSYYHHAATLLLLKRPAEASEFSERALEIRQAMLEPDHPELADSYHQLGYFHFWMEDYEKSRPLLMRALRMREEGLEEGHPSLLQSYNALGFLCQNELQHRQALGYFQQAIAVGETYPWQHPDLARAYTGAGLFYSQQTRYEEARLLLQKAIFIYESCLPNDHPTLALTHHNLANVLYRMSSFEKALVVQQKAVAIRESILDPADADLGASYYSLGWIYQFLQRYEEALGIARKALDILGAPGVSRPIDGASANLLVGSIYYRLGDYTQASQFLNRGLKLQEAILPEGHADIGFTYFSIALAYAAEKNYHQAVENYYKALVIRETALPPLHPDLAQTYYNLALGYWKLGQLDLAQTNMQKALAIREAILPINNHELADTHLNLGGIRFNLEQYESARLLYHKGLEIKERILGFKHRDLAVPYIQLVSIYVKINRLDRARHIMDLVVQIREAALDPLHPDLAWAYHHMGIIHARLREWEQMRDRTQQALKIREVILIGPHNDLAESYHNVGVAQNELKQFDAARLMLEKARQNWELTLPVGHPSLILCYRNLALTYEMLGYTSEAEEFRGKAAY